MAEAQKLSGWPDGRTALIAAVMWTLAIFVACLLPGKELPQSDIPFIDKWTHFVLFGVFAFLWLCAYPSIRFVRLLQMVIVATLLGVAIEFLQSSLPRLGRHGDAADAAADSVGGALGVACFWVWGKWKTRSV